MNANLANWNFADEPEALDAMIACCGARRWAAAMVATRPLGSIVALSEAADETRTSPSTYRVTTLGVTRFGPTEVVSAESTTVSGYVSSSMMSLQRSMHSSQM